MLLVTRRAKQSETKASFARVRKTDVTVDETFNVRQAAVDAAEDRALGESIGSEGLIQHPVVRKLDDGSYFLLAGFRRFRAAPGDEIDVKVVECDDLTAYLINATENVQRKNLKPYELADRIALLRRKFSVDTKTLAERLRLSPSYVRNLYRLRTKLHPDLWKLFVSYGESLASYEELLRICAMPASEQVEAWRALRAAKEKQSENRGKSSRGRAVPCSKLTAYAASVEADLAVGRLDRRYAEGLLYGLRLAMGEAEWDKPAKAKAKER